MKLCVIGTGYVGLVSGVCYAELGNKVICVDNDEQKVIKLKKGIMPIYEENLEGLCQKNVQNGNIQFTTDLKYGVENSDIIFIAVGTPSLPSGHADLSQVDAVAREIAQHMNGYKVIVNKSTVPVGTQKRVTQIIKENQKEKNDFDVVSNPEFLREGTAVFDTINADRIVIGAESQRAIDMMTELNEPFDTPILVVTPESSEMIKYAANAFLAAKISFINEIANICEGVGANVEHVAKGIGLDQRISPKFLSAGIGFGGACFPKDTKALIKIGEAAGYIPKIVQSTIEVNERQKLIPVDKLKTALGTLENKVIGILGLAFKPKTDDMREAPSIDIINQIRASGGQVKAYDPIAMDAAKTIWDDITYCDNPYDVAKDSDAVILVTEWKEFTKLDLQTLKQSMKNPVFIDGRNIFRPKDMKAHGFKYYCIGKGEKQ